MVAVQNKGPILGMRHVQVMLIFLNIASIGFSRSNVGIAIVAMTNAESTNPDFPQYVWSEQQISYIISSFFWGYIFTQFLGGILSKRFGAKIIMFIATFCSALLGALTPWCISWGSWRAYCGVRILQGLFQGTIFPGIYQHLAKWSPLQERNRLGALANTGIECGTILALGVSGIIAKSTFGWPGISYCSAGMCFVWCALWLGFASNNATESRFITEQEKQYIESSMDHAEDFHKKKIPVPWKAIAFSIPFHAVLIVRCATSWGITTMQAQMPRYFNGVLGMDMGSNALYSALPFMAMWAMSYVYVIISNVIQNRKLLSSTTMRKSINTFALWLPAVTLIAVGFLEQDQKTLAIILMTVGIGVSSGNTIGSALCLIDLSPNHAGILMGINNTVQNVMPLIAPLVVGVIVTDHHNRSEWQIVFIITSVIFFFGNLIYIIWGSGNLQAWDAKDFLLANEFNDELSSNTSKLSNDGEMEEKKGE